GCWRNSRVGSTSSWLPCGTVGGMLSESAPCFAGIDGSSRVEVSLPWLPGITIGAEIDEPCCAAAGAPAPIAIASPITAAASAEIELRPMPGNVVVAIAMQALRRSGARWYVMILFAPALGKPVSFSRALDSQCPLRLTNSRRQSFRVAQSSRDQTLPGEFMAI